MEPAVAFMTGAVFGAALTFGVLSMFLRFGRNDADEE